MQLPQGGLAFPCPCVSDVESLLVGIAGAGVACDVDAANFELGDLGDESARDWFEKSANQRPLRTLSWEPSLKLGQKTLLRART